MAVTLLQTFVYTSVGVHTVTAVLDDTFPTERLIRGMGMLTSVMFVTLALQSDAAIAIKTGDGGHYVVRTLAAYLSFTSLATVSKALARVGELSLSSWAALGLSLCKLEQLPEAPQDRPWLAAALALASAGTPLRRERHAPGHWHWHCTASPR